ncbi:MAG TPA: TMEM165/GDT1 family protein [Bacillota bacterium]|nr:TMEM165/GDT1 family protein [Bacillota bacterium]
MSVLLLTSITVFLAEMGDKTQLVAMAFVAQFGAAKVLGAISAAIVANTALAVLLGEGLSRLVPFSTLQLIAAIGFLGFGLWSLRCGEPEDCDVPGECKGNPFWTIFLAFFVAELGDKTQLVTLGLTAQQGNPWMVFAGASLGLVAAGALGIFLSSFIYKFIPPRAVQLGAALLFFIFGTVSLYSSVPKSLKTVPIILAYFAVLGSLSYLIVKKRVWN